ncbi:MAG: HAD family hydrolase [Kiloniellaceae bacterium]
MAIKGILFDKDGTLLDYAATWMPVNRAAALAAAGGDAELSQRLLVAGGYDPVRGRVAANTVLAAGNSTEIAAAWLEHLPGWNAAQVIELLDRIFEREGAECAVPVTELGPLFARLKMRGLKLGVATSDSERGVRATLRDFGVLDLLDYVAGYDSGHGMKPHPGMVHGFCESTGLAAAEVAVVGDNLHDLEMGRRAGAGLIVGVLSGTGERDELAAHADHVLDSILGLEALLDRP